MLEPASRTSSLLASVAGVLLLLTATPIAAQRLHDPDRQPPIHPYVELLWGIQGWNFWTDGSPPTVVLQAPDHVWTTAALQSPAAAMLLRAYRYDPGLYYAEPLGFGRDAMVGCGGRRATRLGAVHAMRLTDEPLPLELFPPLPDGEMVYVQRQLQRDAKRPLALLLQTLRYRVPYPIEVIGSLRAVLSLVPHGWMPVYGLGSRAPVLSLTDVSGWEVNAGL